MVERARGESVGWEMFQGVSMATYVQEDWRLGLAGFLTISGILVSGGNPCWGQITPDTTLGAESSVVTPGANVGGIAADRIDGGATRGMNLFHSFEQFNVGEGQRVYFANPTGIENILTRVTGTNASYILGTLGVSDGSANLFVINPNGIIFGPNAHLDIHGSFFASTASNFKFPDGSEFSATHPTAPPLLTVNVTPGLQWGTSSPGATITNTGNLAVGQNLTLVADKLDLQGEVQAGGDLTLLAQDTVKMRDSVTTPFSALAGGNLTVVGNGGIDIKALNHPTQMPFVSGGNLSLFSDGIISLDAHFSSGGSFSIKSVSGGLANIVSYYDPIVRAVGDVRFDTYQGTSLHILAGGQVDIGAVTITDVAANQLITEDVRLSNGTVLAIDGSTQPTLDIRAGMNPVEIMGTLGLSGILNPANPVLATPTRAGISIGRITMEAPNGLVFLTNQYKPDLSLPGGAIAVRTLRTDDDFGGFLGNSGSVLIDSRGDITVGDRINTASASGDAGNITLLAQDAIELDGSLIVSDTGGFGQGGDISIRARSFTLANGGQLQSNTSGSGDAGNVTIVASGPVLIGGRTSPLQSGIFSQVTSSGSGAGGDITIEAESVSLIPGLNKETRLEARNQGRGEGGDITIIARDTVSFEGAGAYTSVEKNALGEAGNITIEAKSVSLVYGSLQSNTRGEGDAGDIRIAASDSVFLDNLFVLSRVNSEGRGNGGDILIETGSLSGINGTRLIASTEGTGDAGNVTIVARDSVSFDGMNKGQLGGAFSSVGSTAVGDGGNIFIEARAVSVTNGSQLVTRTNGAGDAGNVTIVAHDSVSFEGISEDGRPSGAFSSVDGAGLGKGGNIEVQTELLAVTNSARLDTSTRGKGDAGNLSLLTEQLIVRDQGTISASTFGQWDAGDITVKASDSVAIADNGLISSGVAADATGNGGNIDIETPSLSLINGGRVETRTLGFIPAFLAADVAEQYANTSYDVAVLADTPVAYWHLDESSGITAFDASGNNFNGTYQGGVTLGQPGVSGTTAKFDGTSGLVNIGNIRPGSALDIQKQSFTVEAWIKPNDSPSNEQVYFGMHSNSQTAESLHLRVYKNGSTRFGYWDSEPYGNNDLDAPQGAITLSDNWYHVVTRYDQASDTSTIFVNGNPIASGSQGPFQGSVPSVVIGNWRNVNDPSFNDRPFFNQPFDGLIDEVAVYNSALPIESIVAHYAIGQRHLGAPVNFRDNGANAGNITVKAESIHLSGVSPNQGLPSGFFSDTEGHFSGQGGDINVTTGSLRVADGALLSTRSQGSGNAGNLDITAGSIELDNQGKLTAESASGRGGNIRLQVQDILVLRHNSEISTQAGNNQTGGDGGNITIDGGLIAAVPGENSDITADAFKGRGGNINITTPGIFGIEFRERRTPLSDITASSEFGVSGNVQINTPGIDPSRGLSQLPTDLVDADGLIDRTCSASGSSNQSSFTVTGRGGLPPTPREALNSDAIQVNWVALDSEEENRDHVSTNVSVTHPAPKPIVEAQGWMKAPNGQVMLVAQAPTVTHHEIWLPSPSCQGSIGSSSSR